MKWSAWPGGSTKRFHVKVNQLKLHGFLSEFENGMNKSLLVEVKWKGGASGVLRSRCQKNYTGNGFFGKGGIVEWDDEFQSLCNFGSKQTGASNSFLPWKLTFAFLHGETTESRRDMVVLGKVSMNLAEVASKMQAQIQTRLSVNLNIEGLIIPIEATLMVSLSFAEVRNSQDSTGTFEDSAESDKESMVSYFRSLRKTSKLERKSSVDREHTDESCLTDSEWSSWNETSTSTGGRSSVELTSKTELGSSLTSEFDSGQKSWFSKKRKWFTPRPPRRKVEPLIERTIEANTVPIDADSWEAREIVSRDGQAKLKTNVFFASFDQRSDKASGESACAVLVAVIAHWLHSNRDSMPTISEFDSLITQGSLDWQKLCSNEAYINLFPNKHFDLETVLGADLRPIDVSPEKSFIGFFSPEKFECLKGHMSFNQIWDEISKTTIFDEPRIYLVSWNDHFFVLKVEANAYYIIDSLGERLFEGCNQAYILRFDDSSIMYGNNLDKTEASSKEIEGSESNREESSQIIGSGKECCREFIKRFLAAIPLKQLEEEQEKKTVSDLTLHQRLQIEFHCSYSSSSFTSSAISSSYSLFSGDECSDIK